MAGAEERNAEAMATQTAARQTVWLRRRAALVIATAALLTSACMIESPTIEPVATETSGDTTTAQPTADPPVFEPTVAPEPTPTPVPTSAPEPTATPTPEPTPSVPVIEAQIPSEFVEPVVTEPGVIAVPVGGTTTFRLARSRPVLQQPGHTLIYIDADRLAEVDIFSPVANGEGDPLGDFAAVIIELTTNTVFADLAELEPVTIAGLPARVFEGSVLTGERGFHTDTSTIGNDWAGWFPPARMRLWVIDAPAGPIVVTAESLFDPGQYDDAVRMAGGLLSTMTFEG
jgi:hypothetical protein